MKRCLGMRARGRSSIMLNNWPQQKMVFFLSFLSVAQLSIQREERDKMDKNQFLQSNHGHSSYCHRSSLGIHTLTAARNPIRLFTPSKEWTRGKKKKTIIYKLSFFFFFAGMFCWIFFFFSPLDRKSCANLISPSINLWRQFLEISPPALFIPTGINNNSRTSGRRGFEVHDLVGREEIA